MGADRIAITRRQEVGGAWVTECLYSEGKISYTNRVFASDDLGGFSLLLEGDMIRCNDVANDQRLTPSTREILTEVGTTSFASVEATFTGEAQLAISATIGSVPR